MNASTETPLVSVVILNYKRRAALAGCLESVRNQSYGNLEVIVVDNASNDNVRKFLTANAPEARLIELSENLGATGGRNAGLLKARGEIVVTLDNDIFLEGPNEVSRIVEAFAARSDVHVLAFHLGDETSGELRVREWCHPKSWTEFGQEEFETNYFVEGACAARAEVYRVAGLYYDPLFIGCEGWDLALRVLDKGFRILYVPSVRARHLMSKETRTPERPYYYYTRNYIWIAFKDYPFSAGLKFLTAKLSMMLYFSFRSKGVHPFLRGVRDGIIGLRRIRANRTRIAPPTLQYLRGLEGLRPNLLTRLSRHRDAVQL
jgi:GT2 family glycosyltransferase